MPPLWYFGLVVLMAHVITVNIAKVNPACECVVYMSHGNTDGRFQTPNYPQHYSQGIECILFTFIGDINEIIEIKFTEFDLMQPSSNGCGDYLKLFLHLDRAEINEYSVFDEILCGNMSNLRQKTFYSKNRSLIMEFHTNVRRPDQLYNPGYSGFRGLFRFKDEKQYKIGGSLQQGTMCSYDFYASQLTGNFFSPSYPQNYPPLSKCQYTFYGQSHEGTVKVQFQNIQIYNDGRSCRDSPDRIAIYDGWNSSAPLIKYLCGIRNQEEVISSIPYLYIEFFSDHLNQGQGFAAKYAFQQKSTSISTPIHQAFNCNQDIFSKDRKSGTIKSQNYPSPYPSSTKCIYTFYGNTSNERIQIKFRRVDLFYPEGDADNPYDCDGQDSIKIYIKIDDDEKELANTCGRKIPKMFMSTNIPWLKVVFDSGVGPKLNHAGFEMEYHFVTNYGITSGRQDDRNLCKFYYHSDVKMSGFFYSPNYPGIYPKDTECSYTFHGKNNEIVRIQFLTFDVDGIIPRCEPKDKVDYVEFSNFDGAVDRKMDKFCGQMTNKISKAIESDLAFFRVTFKSNSQYEGNGFNASYQFIQVEDTKTDQPPGRISASGSLAGTVHVHSYIVLFILTLVALKTFDTVFV